MKRLAGLLLFLFAASTALGGELRLNWLPVPGAASYKVFVGASSGDYTLPPLTSTDTFGVVSVPDGGPYFACVKAVSPNGLESVNCSGEVSSWARPVITNTTALNTGGLNYIATIRGSNFAPDTLTTITYPGLTQGDTVRISASQVDVAFALDSGTVGGTAAVTVANPWVNTSGTSGVAGPTDPDAFPVVPAIPPADVTGVEIL